VLPKKAATRAVLITLTTDFGLQDSYVAQMKGAILRLAPRANIIDISHGVQSFDIPSASRILSEAAPEFPANTIHVAVVDPGVGTSRRRIIIQIEVSNPRRAMFFVGPDNGIFSDVISKGELIAAWEITNLDKLPKRKNFPEFSTFDGRDVFAPTAALLATGIQPDEFGSQVKNLCLLNANAQYPAGTGSVVSIDRFGNAITDIPAAAVSGKTAVEVEGLIPEVGIYNSYAELPPAQLGALISSQGTLELAIYTDSAAERFGLRKGLAVKIK